ncbi:DUF6275 family protein [Clostridium beijerinckii]|uniref:Phage protein n=1 Tax=Clostridium beijerinckii TaxID=1520 RepID=A0A7X9SQP4_CLOBE|nr:DUF6275 family protein [Clostridium beijerinckii]NMF06265.1 hypothetical protein [Clostridium beijerinckii]
MNEFIEKCKNIVIAYVGDTNVTKDDVFVVWSCKTLQNKKALLSATFKGAPYFEITYNGDKDENYVDVYKKEKNYVVK